MDSKRKTVERQESSDRCVELSEQVKEAKEAANEAESKLHEVSV